MERTRSGWRRRPVCVRFFVGEALSDAVLVSSSSFRPHRTPSRTHARTAWLEDRGSTSPGASGSAIRNEMQGRKRGEGRKKRERRAGAPQRERDGCGSVGGRVAVRHFKSLLAVFYVGRTETTMPSAALLRRTAGASSALRPARCAPAPRRAGVVKAGEFLFCFVCARRRRFVFYWRRSYTRALAHTRTLACSSVAVSGPCRTAQFAECHSPSPPKHKIQNRPSPPRMRRRPLLPRRRPRRRPPPALVRTWKRRCVLVLMRGLE
jgi:hypothetical protein